VRPRGRARSAASSPPSRTSHDTGAVGAGLALVVIGSLVWATGQLAGLLASGRWPPVGVSAVPGIAVRLVTHLSDAAAAWPVPARRLLPGPVAMGAVGGLVVLVTAAMGLLAARVVARRGGLAGARRSPPGRMRVSGPSPGARWATRTDLRRLAVGRSAGARVVLGRSGRALVATEARHSVLVLGPTQSGKSTSLAIPALLEWPGPVVATSVKDDLVAATRPWRSTLGHCLVFDPTSGSTGATLVPGDGTATWSPLAEAATWMGAQRMASWLVDATPARSGMTDGGFWFAAATKLLGPLLLAAARGGRSMADVVRWTDGTDLDEPLAVLDAAGEAEAAAALGAGAARDPRLRSSITTTLETVLQPFEDPVVQRATASCDIDPRALLTGPHSLFLCGPSHEQTRVQGLFAALVSSVVATAVEMVHERGSPLDPPLLLVLDEAANIAPLRDLDTLASTSAGLGIQMVTICQDLAQLAGRYGAERSRTIANNHRAKLVLSGVADLGTLDLISGLAGETAVEEATETRDLRDGHRTRTTAVAFRRLAPTDELRRTPPGQGVLVYGHLPAARLTLRPWYREAALRAKVPPGVRRG
jgi:type IV secretion system protein VirD4